MHMDIKESHRLQTALAINETVLSDSYQTIWIHAAGRCERS